MSNSRILLVEDHPTSRKLLAAMLKRSYEVILAASGQEAIGLALEHQPDMVLLDIEMPGMDGFETLDILRSGVIDPSVPCIFLTAREDSESREKGLQAGAVDYLTKPYDRHELSIKVKNHLELYAAKKEIQKANDQMAQEMEMAYQLQRSLLPQAFPSNTRISFSVAYKPSSKASGDFYDVVEMPDGRIAFAQVDVSGHGVRSAMIGAMFKMAFQSFVREKESPSQLLSRINDNMVAVIPDSDYLTVFYGIIDVKTLRLDYSNAAHPKPFLFRNDTGEVTELFDGGTIVGAFEGMDYDQGSEQLRQGDRLLIYTDGVTEARRYSDDLELYGETRLKEVFMENLGLTSEEMLNNILRDIEKFQGHASFEDDVSLLLISVE